MKVSDTTLLKWYQKGFKDELWGTTSTVPNNLLKQKAYKLGAIHAVVGDDVRSVDYLSGDEILKQIKSFKTENLK